MDGKPRIDAFDASLTEDQRWETYAKMKRFPHGQVAEWAAAEYGIEPPSKSALYRFAARMRGEESAHRIEQALAVKADVERTMEQVGDMDAELQYAWTQMAMQSALAGDAEAGQRYLAMAMKLRESATETAKLALKGRALERAEAQLALMREKWEASEARLRAASDALKRAHDSGGLSAEARAEIEKAMGIL
jgi:hypothetical protein